MQTFPRCSRMRVMKFQLAPPNGRMGSCCVLDMTARESLFLTTFPILANMPATSNLNAIPMMNSHFYNCASPPKIGGDFLLHTIIPHQKLVGYYCKYSKYMVWCAWWHTTLRHSPSSHCIKGRLAKLRKGGCHESYYYIPKTMHSRTVRLRADS